MGSLSFYFLLSFTFGLFILSASQLQSSQFYVLLQLRKHLEYPNQLEIWGTQKTDICYLTPSLQMNVTCSGDSVSELRIMGDKPSKISSFDGYPIPNLTLSGSFSMDSFVTTLTRLPSLKVLCLVSLGIWGPLPDKIHRLSSLEYLDLSSNFIFGSIPPRISSLSSLKTLILDGNFLNNTVPDWIGSLPNLAVLSLTNNQLMGPLPSSIGKITSLTNLALSNNQISGELPDLSRLSSLTMLDLSGNKLNSKLPSFPNNLVMAFLSNSSFTGEIPDEIDQLNHLQHLDLSLNQLRGKLPITLFSLQNISYLNLASNSLTGSLPYHLKCGGKLSFVDISNNRLTGGLPRCLSSTISKFNGNCLSVDVKRQHPGSYCSGDGADHVGKADSKVKGLTVLLVVIGVLAVILGLFAFGFVVMCRRYCPRGCSEQHLLKKQVIESTVTGVTPEILANARLISQAAKTGTQGTNVCRVFSIEELKEATNNFDKLAYLGEGSRGKVYKGRLQNGTQVAIRCMFLSHKFTIRNLKLRLDLLAKIRHTHLVSLLGHCIDSNRGQNEASNNMNNVYLVYEYAPNGSLKSYLYDCEASRALKWPERLTNLIDVAKAVHFLHTGVIPGFFNNRLKMHNILMDENRRAKLSDYGLSVISDDKDTNKMKMLEDDIYSFGFMLLEAIIGTSVSTRKDAFLFSEMASLGSKEGRRRMVDPLVVSSSSEESLSIVITLTNKCLSSESTTRPSFEDILWNLQYAAQVQTTEDSDHRVDSPVTTHFISKEQLPRNEKQE
ncbi:hypothetical protein V2J09_006881 [Rumex salicifolius]